MAVCPHCDKPLSELTVNPMEGKLPIGVAFNCILLSCPSCQKALSAVVDTSAAVRELRAEVEKMSGKAASS